jgi:hypothetical protein
VLETSCTIEDWNYSILIDPSDPNNFISSAPLKRIKVKEVEQDEFKYVEMASSSKQNVGGKVTDCILTLEDFVTMVDTYFMILGYYNIVIGMDWLESHNVILNCNMK